MNASRILILLHQMSLTGSPRLALDTVQALQGEASLRLVAWEGGPLLDWARLAGPTVVLRPAGSALREPRRPALMGAAQLLGAVGWRARSLREAAVLRNWRPQLVYVSSVEALPLVRILRLGGVPVVLHVHELGSALAWLEKRHPGLIRSIPTHYVAVSNAVARDLVDDYRVAAGAVTVVPPYVLPPLPEPVPTSGHGDPRPLIVGGAGKPSWTKGIDLWLLAAREVVDRLGPDAVRFCWVGYRDNLDGLQFKAMISRLDLQGAVELVLETDRPYDRFAGFDMLAMSSWEESASLVVLEAMAMGLPVICFAPTGGPAEEVGEAGIVLPEISPHLLAEAIVELARSPDRRQALGSAGAARVRQHYGRDAAVEALIRVLDGAFAGDSAAAIGAGGDHSRDAS